jgi:hypothetical protein
VGVISGFTRIVSVMGTPHCPSSGVKLYAMFPAIEVDIEAGFQLPLIPLFEVSGKIGKTMGAF